MLTINHLTDITLFEHSNRAGSSVIYLVFICISTITSCLHSSDTSCLKSTPFGTNIYKQFIGD